MHILCGPSSLSESFHCQYIYLWNGNPIQFYLDRCCTSKIYSSIFVCGLEHLALSSTSIVFRLLSDSPQEVLGKSGEHYTDIYRTCIADVLSVWAIKDTSLSELPFIFLRLVVRRRQFFILLSLSRSQPRGSIFGQKTFTSLWWFFFGPILLVVQPLVGYWCWWWHMRWGKCAALCKTLRLCSGHVFHMRVA